MGQGGTETRENNWLEVRPSAVPERSPKSRRARVSGICAAHRRNARRTINALRAPCARVSGISKTVGVRERPQSSEDAYRVGWYAHPAMPARDAIYDDLCLAAELSDLAEELRQAAVTTGKHPATDRIAGNRYHAVDERLGELRNRLGWRASVLAPRRTPRAERTALRGEVATTATGVAADVPVFCLGR